MGDRAQLDCVRRTYARLTLLDGISVPPASQRVLSAGEKGDGALLGGCLGARSRLGAADVSGRVSRVAAATPLASECRPHDDVGSSSPVPTNSDHLPHAQSVIARRSAWPSLKRSIRSVGVKSPAIRLVVVSDVRLYRDGLAQILGGESRLAVVGTASDAEAAVQLALTKTPDVALVDMGMPQSVTTVREMAARAAIVKIVALAVREDEQDLVACAAAGVAAYVTRGASVADLVQALDGVARGELLCSPQTAATLWRRLPPLARDVHRQTKLRDQTARRARRIIAPKRTGQPQAVLNLEVGKRGDAIFVSGRTLLREGAKTGFRRERVPACRVDEAHAQVDRVECRVDRAGQKAVDDDEAQARADISGREPGAPAGE